MRDYARMMAESEYVSEVEVEEREFAVDQAKLEVELSKTQIDVLERFTKEEQLATLRGELNSAQATYEADKERALADEHRLKRSQEELESCVVRAERSGMVIYPSGRDWEEAPRMEEGATVHKDQVMLLMPDLSQMQVKVGIHESTIDRVRPDLLAHVTMPGSAIRGRVSSVSRVTRPAGWWTGNVVKYDTIIELPPTDGLKPGMSVEVEVILARHDDVLLIPNTAIFESGGVYSCWIKREREMERRRIVIGDSSDLYTIVVQGLQEGDEVVLDPLAHVEEAQLAAAAAIEGGRGELEDGE